MMLVLLVVSMGLSFALAAGSARAASSAPPVLELKLQGVVDPFTASYLTRGIDQANAEGDTAVLITIDTPGGLDSSMRTIIKSILESKVPVICYTSPPGARAASAGTFIMMACPISAMAPGTNIGAAHPVGVSGAIEQAKVTNDAAAFIASLADQWNRNADWAKKAVRDATSVTAETAVKIHAVDLEVPDVASLFQTVGQCGGATGTRVTTGLLRDRGSIPAVCGATISRKGMGLGAAILHGLISPDFAFLFFYVGLVLIVIELIHPGIGVSGILGALFLVGAFVSFGLLPVQLAGIVLLVASAVFFLLELKHPGIGFPTVGGVATLILGGLVLFDPSVPNARVSLWLLVLVAATVVLFFAFVVKAVMSARRLPKPGGLEDLIGQEGVAVTDLAPDGQVRARREAWSATSPREAITSGAEVRIVGVEGLRLIVEPIAEEGEPTGHSLAAREGGQT
jgi:membrane-bound serine protease (ClpP class)